MCSNKNIIGKSIALIVGSSPLVAFAHLNIVSSEGRSEDLKPLQLQDDVYKQIVDIGKKKFIKHPVDSFASDLPLGLALPSIVPSNWSIEITDNLSQFPVTWEKAGNWDEVIVEISKRHDLVIMFDWNRNVLKMDTNDAELLDTFTTKDLEEPVDADTLESAKNVADALVGCDVGSEGCSNPKVDIEKLVLDTDWMDSKEVQEHSPQEPSSDSLTKTSDDTPLASELNDVDSVSPSEALRLEKEAEKAALEEAIENDRRMKADYRSAVVLHGDGSYEDFVNGGGKVKFVDPDEEYVYVFKRGKLFETIDKWAELNGFHVENDIFVERKVDYPNAQDIKIKGKFKDVTTLLLNKYRKAEVPVNHRYFVGGGSNTLHIFESKYESLYVN